MGPKKGIWYKRLRTTALGNKALVLQFVKSPSSVNPYMTKQEDIYLQGEDRIFFNLSQRQSNGNSKNNRKHTLLFGGEATDNNSNHHVSSGTKHWITIAIPHNYIGSSWPIRVRYLQNFICTVSKIYRVSQENLYVCINVL